MTKMYGTSWCGDCHRAKSVLKEAGENYEWFDVEEDPQAREHLVSVVGKVKVPLIEFEDGSHLIEPSNDRLREQLRRVRKA